LENTALPDWQQSWELAAMLLFFLPFLLQPIEDRGTIAVMSLG
jgi:hypothetical protein